jgi:cob(I)alamin adenosyltransferase
MKIYTKTGDSGETGLFAGPRVSKADPRIEAYGTVDELNAVIGCGRAAQPPAEIDSVLARIQHELFVVGAELATPAPERLGMTRIGEPQIAALELAIDQFEVTLPPLTQFILPGGSPVAAAIHMARTVCRRAERCVVGLSLLPKTRVSENLVKYLNRLGDLLFVLARVANSAASQPDVPWEQPE